jgi:GR25 family glycosyltransferase involved in LPS biosynthesis
MLLYFFYELLKRYTPVSESISSPFKKYTEGFDSIDYVVIHLPNSSKERKDNIENLKMKLGDKPLVVLDAVDSSDLDTNNLSKYDDALVIKHKSERGVGEYGCYLSHFIAIKNIRGSNGYTIVFEDDANILSDHFQEDIERIIDSVDNFDIIF